jgi:hypothetical protein
MPADEQGGENSTAASCQLCVDFPFSPVFLVVTIPNFYSGYLYCAPLRHVIHGPHEPFILDDLRRRRSYFRIPSQYLSYKPQKHFFFFARRNSGDKVLEGGLGNWGFRYPIACCHRVSDTSCLVFRLGIKDRELGPKRRKLSV